VTGQLAAVLQYSVLGLSNAFILLSEFYGSSASQLPGICSKEVSYSLECACHVQGSSSLHVIGQKFYGTRKISKFKRNSNFPTAMPLDSSAYGLGGYRPDGRRKGDLRRFHAQISTQAAADGSSYLELGNTMISCTVNGPAEGRRAATSAGSSDARIEASISIAGFSGIDRKKASRNNR
jgi:hypothetical protein